METTVFYAWQSDRSAKQHRYFLRDALEAILANLNAEARLEDAVRLEHDTKGISGTPEIAGTIFDKISNCHVFVGDVTFVGKTDEAGDEVDLLPNPNVLLELGFAARELGWGRIILVMNEFYGTAIKLPFDLRNRRWPITYNWPVGDSKLDNKNQFVGALRTAILQAMEAEHSAVNNAVGSLDESCLILMQAAQGEPFSGPETKEQTLFETIEIANVKQTIRTLINLKLLFCDVSAAHERYMYHWSPLGKLVLKKVGIKFKQVESIPVSLSFQVSTG